MMRAHGVERALHFGTTEPHVHQAPGREVAALGRGSALARIPTFADLALDVLLAECLLGMEGVVRAAAHAQVPGLVRAAEVQRSPSRSKTSRRVARETRAVGALQLVGGFENPQPSTQQ